ncbi:hypothetical protein SDC9_121472 [bioreactor metagenome]|uniref:Acid-resistance membrane protein n=1 Tax=bioreactor metagenome TaxID=1076179 RepID=A0A645CC31_9ZZZZ
MSEQPVSPEVTAAPVDCCAPLAECCADFKKLLRASKAILLLRGLIFLILGVLLWAHPVAAMTAIVIVLGIYILFEGGLMLGAAFGVRGRMRTMLTINAIALLLLGLAAIVAPLWMGEFAVIFFGVWQLMSGIQCLIFPSSNGLSKTGAILSGILSLLAGLFFIGAPLFGLVVFGVLFAVLFFISGVLMLIAGFSLR